MIQLCDSFDNASRDLHFSLKNSGYLMPTLVLNDDGFLPEGVSSPYAYFCQMENAQGKPLYFNQVQIPLYWEITGNNSEAEIWFYDELKAKIVYAEPKHLRLVKMVDWYDKNHRVRLTEHYNRYGCLFARTHFGQNEVMSMKTYFNQQGQEVIVENYLTGDIILNWKGRTHCFKNQFRFLDFYIEEMKWDRSKMIYNALSKPFLYSYYHQEPGRDILFWQEEVAEAIPGNMQALLDDSNSRTQMIVVQNKTVYDKIVAMVSDEVKSMFRYLGYIYPQVRENQGRKQVFIFTNSDQIEQLDYLVRALADYEFHIAALTEMSSYLLAFDKYENVHLYPNVSSKLLAIIYSECDIYLDINWANEVMGAVRQAFEQGMLIFGFKQTVHNKDLILEEHLFDMNKPERLVETLRSYEGQIKDKAHDQIAHFNESPEAYRRLLGELDF